MEEPRYQRADAVPPPPGDPLGVQLEVAEERLRLVLGLTDSIVFEFDSEGRYVGIWTRSDDLLAMPREQAMGRTLVEVHGPQAGAVFMERLQQTLETRQPVRFE